MIHIKHKCNKQPAPAMHRHLLEVYFHGYTQILDRPDGAIARPFWRIYYNPTPGHRIEYGDTCHLLDPDHVCLIPPHTAVRQFVSMPVDSFYVHASFGAEHDTPPRQVFLPCIPRYLRELAESLISMGYKENKSDNSRLDLMLACYAYGALALLDSDSWPSAPHDSRIRRVLQYLEKNACRRPDNLELAKVAGMSTNGFGNLFKKEVGVPPQTWLMRRRLTLAAQHLLRGDDTIDAIAIDLGFYDRSYFSKLFRRYYGQSPAAFRQSVFC